MTNLGRTILQDAIATPTGYQRMPKSLEMEIKCSSSHQINSRVSEKNALIIYIYIIYYILYIYISIYSINLTILAHSEGAHATSSDKLSGYPRYPAIWLVCSPGFSG
jgi:hypothetical protein